MSQNVFEYEVSPRLKIERTLPYALTLEDGSTMMLSSCFPTRICINGVWHKVITPSEAVRMRNKEDGCYRFIYIQIDWATGEYYIGKVNRKRWSEVDHYQGSGLRFRASYKKHGKDYSRFYIAHCKTEEETEDAERAIVNESLLEDPFCLNLVQGGGGINRQYGDSEGRKTKIREYMKNHPENYQAMLKAAQSVFKDKNSGALVRRSRSIKKTMADEKYKRMMSERIKRWRAEHPEQYQKARENNKAAAQSAASRQRRKEASKKRKAEHPEQYHAQLARAHAAAHTEEARLKRSRSLKQWAIDHPDEVRARSQKVAGKNARPVNMINLSTGKVEMTFNSFVEAARWLVDKGLAKNLKCKSTLWGVCRSKEDPSVRGRKTAYGYDWAFADKR